MANTTRAEELVKTMDNDVAFQQEVQAAGTVAAKRSVLDRHGFSDVTLEDMKAYVESKGGKLEVPAHGGELSEQELEAVAGGLTQEESNAIAIGGGVAVGVAAAAAA